MKHFFFAIFLLSSSFSFSQRPYWQHKADYEISIDMNNDFTFTGSQQIRFTNNSSENLNQVFYHLYFNAFQPGSMMDVRSQDLPDPDRRVADRIAQLSPEEIGLLEPTSLKLDGKKLDYVMHGTILQVPLKKEIKPGETVVLSMDFRGQVPLQIRRSGKNNREGIDLSMTQWYPKLCNHDDDGWHPNPYIGREFYGIWGDFNVKITLDAKYIVGATGYLQNPDEVGYGYQEEGVEVDHTNKDKLTWHFVAPNVHDFMWAADPEYLHYHLDVKDGPRLHFLFKGEDSVMVANWSRLGEYTAKAFEIANERFGKYPYNQYSVIQGGDGGMEYPMGTLITGRRSFGSLVGVTVHELMHSWYQMVLATHELLYPWMDEGFTSYGSEIIMNELFPSEDEPRELHQQAYASYFSIAGTEDEDVLNTHADHYRSNRAYGIASYSKGQVYLHQLSYIIGQDALDRTLLRYYDEWKFKHPKPSDFLRVAEKESGMVLDWYNEYFVSTTATVDYAVRGVESAEGKTKISMEKVGRMPMPVEVLIKKKSGEEELHYIPLVMMFGEKQSENKKQEMIRHAAWPWTHPVYTFNIDIPAKDIARIEIDPSYRMADVDRSNNLVLLPGDFHLYLFPKQGE
jgi:hypothetical protein